MKTKTILTTIILSLAFYLSEAQNVGDFFEKTNSLLSKNVKNGLVDYKQIQEDQNQLIEVLDLASKISVSKDNAKDYQAFWINAYNIHVIKGIIDNYPVKSPLDIDGFFDKTFRDVGGKQITLNDIENKLLRANFPEEPRFHFVLVCAGLGCPPIINEAYLPNKLESQLQRQTQLALNDPGFLRVKGKKVLLSQIFEWYKEDFTRDGKSEVDFINQFRQNKLESNVKVSYYPYDWTLNEIK